MTTAANGNTVSVHYRGTFEDGTEFDSSHSRGTPMTITVGSGQLIEGFDSALVGMESGETKNITLTPDQAYGDFNPAAIQEIPLTAFPEDFEFKVGATVYGENSQGQKIIAKINQLNDSGVVLDFNHPMAGKNLNFEIEIENIQE